MKCGNDQRIVWCLHFFMQYTEKLRSNWILDFQSIHSLINNVDMPSASLQASNKFSQPFTVCSFSTVSQWCCMLSFIFLTVSSPKYQPSKTLSWISKMIWEQYQQHDGICWNYWCISPSKLWTWSCHSSSLSSPHSQNRVAHKQEYDNMLFFSD